MQLPAKIALQMYCDAWSQFKAEYADYRPDSGNWWSHQLRI